MTTNPLLAAYRAAITQAASTWKDMEDARQAHGIDNGFPPGDDERQAALESARADVRRTTYALAALPSAPDGGLREWHDARADVGTDEQVWAERQAQLRMRAQLFGY